MPHYYLYRNCADWICFFLLQVIKMRAGKHTALPSGIPRYYFPGSGWDWNNFPHSAGKFVEFVWALPNDHGLFPHPLWSGWIYSCDCCYLHNEVPDWRHHFSGDNDKFHLFVWYPLADNRFAYFPVVAGSRHECIRLAYVNCDLHSICTSGCHSGCASH